MNYKFLALGLLSICSTAAVSAQITPIDYNSGFTTPIDVITSDQTTGPITGDPTTGVTFTNPSLFLNTGSGTIENYNPYTQAFGGPVTVFLPTQADAFGIAAGANSGGSDAITLMFLEGFTEVGTATFTIPSGQPANPIDAAFSSTVDFNTVVIEAPGNGFVRIGDDSIKFQAAAVATPDSISVLCPLGAFLLLALARGRRAQSVA